MVDSWYAMWYKSDILRKLKEINTRIFEYDGFRRQDEGNEISFIDNDDGKSVTIKLPSGSKVYVPSIKFVHDEDSWLIEVALK